MSILDLARGRGEEIDQLKAKVKSLQETVDLQLESVITYNERIAELCEDKRKLEEKIERLKIKEVIDD